MFLQYDHMKTIAVQFRSSNCQLTMNAISGAGLRSTTCLQCKILIHATIFGYNRHTSDLPTHGATHAAAWYLSGQGSNSQLAAWLERNMKVGMVKEGWARWVHPNDLPLLGT